MPTNEEMARAVAEWCGWRIEDEQHWWDGPNGEFSIDLPDFANSLDACREFEAEIERRGLEHEYVTALRVPVLSRLYGPFSTADVFKLMHATAAQKLAAAYAVVQGLEKNDA